jgi:hypothetical protein
MWKLRSWFKTAQNWDWDDPADDVTLTVERRAHKQGAASNLTRVTYALNDKMPPREGSWIFTSLKCFSLPWSPRP